MTDKDEYAKKMLDMAADFFDKYPEPYEMDIITEKHHIKITLDFSEYQVF